MASLICGLPTGMLSCGGAVPFRAQLTSVGGTNLVNHLSSYS